MASFLKLYELLSRNPLTRTLVQKVRKKYEIICPLQERFIQKKTIQTILFTWLVIGLEFLLIYLMHPGVFQALLGVVLAIILHSEMIQFNVRSMELKILTQFEEFLTDLRHHYYVSHMIDEAILDSLDHTGVEMTIQANQFLAILSSEEREALAEQYSISSHNSFLNLFLALCVTVVEYGDRQVQGQSLFLMNLANLKSEVNIEILKMRQTNYLYSGLTFVILCPMILLKVIEQWAVSNLPELKQFYSGMGGFLAMSSILLISMGIYFIVSDLKEFRVYLPKGHRLLNFLLQKHWIAEKLYWYELKNPNRIYEWKEKIQASGEILQVRQLILVKILSFLGTLITLNFVFIFLSIRDGKRFEWYELVLAIVAAMGSYWIPDLRLAVHKKMTEWYKEDEIVRFQSIVLMLMYIERITVVEILERIEEFAAIFRRPIQNCINDYNYSDLAALEELKDQGNFLPFDRFVDQLMISDEIGIEKAFDEVAADREHFREKRRQENAQSLEQRSALATFLAYIPAVCVIGGYLILPFLLECYRRLNEYSVMLRSAL